ncbi:hypothetical protein ABZT03_40010 [Streptomyces sp. NPDC005574]|uniref:DUF6895 family protein n=1 Tax=Streptomyces sp. NPDC005574 TaxID=3156891 RepID=UPI0033A6269E
MEAHARAVRRRACAWVSAHRDRFALGEDALAPDGQVNSSWKPLGELAQVCASVLAHTAPPDPTHARAGDLLAFAWRQTGHGELFVRLQQCEPFATYPLEVYGAFAAAGLRRPEYERAAATVARARGWRLTEQDPTRRLGVLTAERRAGIHRPEHDSPTLERTWLGGLAEPWTFERFSGYALTHVVFHLTDWGRTPDALPADLATYLTHWLPPWLDTCLDAGMWDLGCELLAVAATLPGPTDPPDPPVTADAWHRISSAQHASGALPEERPSPADPQDADDEPGFTHCYHSTLMAAFAAALTLGRRHLHRAGHGRGDGEERDLTGAWHAEPAAGPGPRTRYDGQGALG